MDSIVPDKITYATLTSKSNRIRLYRRIFVNRCIKNTTKEILNESSSQRPLRIIVH